ncbi:pseudouridine synthase [Trichosporon asahii var. asahii CBS 2479]|uniref:Pseudouridine synthase n=1 Tax=Trichosporon asahii var. asahii (strain ATCC 90039 / CBS 2479 / JCM 2466 / KCTC 7840 / NBRC 103889/ NCYC 2677 / UAMH 7654) TaxID=1186058 RepID=J5T3Y7_TRIAS|nr:pseudouridine synthase [Trichosporon asahii var. asahii CBS 2479]EJT49021.1 pseudouridine synthase [Trichosporon asahii var. asahii CBS 2479]
MSAPSEPQVEACKRRLEEEMDERSPKRVKDGDSPDPPQFLTSFPSDAVPAVSRLGLKPTLPVMPPSLDIITDGKTDLSHRRGFIGEREVGIIGYAGDSDFTGVNGVIKQRFSCQRDLSIWTDVMASSSNDSKSLSTSGADTEVPKKEEDRGAAGEDAVVASLPADLNFEEHADWTTSTTIGLRPHFSDETIVALRRLFDEGRNPQPRQDSGWGSREKQRTEQMNEEEQAMNVGSGPQPSQGRGRGNGRGGAPNSNPYKAKDAREVVTQSARGAAHQAVRELLKGNFESTARDIGGKGQCLVLKWAASRSGGRDRKLCGTKDKRAITVQRVSLKRGSLTTQQVWRAVNGVRSGRRTEDGAVAERGERGTRIGDMEYSTHPLELGSLKGNHNVQAAVEDIDKAMKSIRDKGFINFYGMQRFGTSTVPTHVTGLLLLQGKWGEAIDSILSLREGEHPDCTRGRLAWLEDGDFSRALELMPRRSVAERSIWEHWRKGNRLEDKVGALGNSYIWNLMAAERMKLSNDQPLEGDLVYEHDAGDDDADNKETSSRDVKRLTSADLGQYTLADVILPLPGWNIEYPGGRIGQLYKDALLADGLDPLRLRRDQREYSLPGSYRRLIRKPTDVSWEHIRYTDPTLPLAQADEDRILNLNPPAADDPNGKFRALKITWSLGTASYATMALRELTREETAIWHQIGLTMNNEDQAHAGDGGKSEHPSRLERLVAANLETPAKTARDRPTGLHCERYVLSWASLTTDPFLETLVTRLYPDPRLPPSTLHLPSLSSPTGQDRDFDPALVVAFNRSAKLLTASDASRSGNKRLLAIGGEEGAIKIIDVDALEPHDSKWWSAHQNGIFDISWCDDDRHLSLRLHDVSGAGPRLLASLHGHTSTIKSTALLHESSSNVIVSGGRDGNINVYDLRCRGYTSTREENGPSLRRSSRTRSTTQISSTGQSSIDPVLTLRQPHNATVGKRTTADSVSWQTPPVANAQRSVARTITSLVALRAQPGILASGGSYDGIVKLWDIRCPEPTTALRFKSAPYGSLPDPTVAGGNPSRRPRSVNALCEQPSTGDLFVLCGDSKVHVLRPSWAKATSSDRSEAILPQKFVHPMLVTRSFYIRMALSPDGRRLACGSSTGGVMMWDVDRYPQNGEQTEATRLEIPHTTPEAPEVIALDWGKDMIAASSDDCATRIWQSNPVVSSQLMLKGQVREEWSGVDGSGQTVED